MAFHLPVDRTRDMPARRRRHAQNWSVMLNRTLMVIAASALVGSAELPAQSQTPPARSAQEMVQIDGSKNPELIPEWSAWGFAFRVFATGSRQLPTTIHTVVSAEEAALILKEADQVQKVDQDCQNRIVKLNALLGKEKIEVLDTRLRELTLECRWATLHARDRLLEVLAPEGASALRAFVASTKPGTSLSIPKKDLARFLEPQ
jgi:hypothetical protein